MDARICLRMAALLAIVASGQPSPSQTLLASDYVTKNFVVRAPDSRFARHVGEAAEVYRRELAVRWLGEELAPWPEKCPISVHIEPQASGQTSFGFAVGAARSQPTGWKMEVCGSPERILDSVLPHEITHTIFATHFGRPLPRWADEGACTTVEHADERSKNHQMLFQFFNERRTIPFNRMFTIKQYPSDIYPIYAQGYSVARFLIMQGGHRHFVDYIDEGLTHESPGREIQTWDAATKKFYGYENLSDLQISWVQWIKQGCPDTIDPKNTPAVASNHSNSAAVPITPHRQVVQANTGDSGLNWYRSQAARVDSSNDAVESLQHPAALSPYQPGSTRESSHVDELIVGQTRIGAPGNEFPPSQLIHGQSAIVDRSATSGTIWR